MQDSRYSRIAKTARFTVAYRLLRRDGFDRVLQAEKITDRYFKVFFVCNNYKNARLGIIASKKILPTATGRNRIKRLIREAFRQHGIRDRKLDIVVMVKSSSPQKASKNSNDLGQLFSRVEDRCAEC